MRSETVAERKLLSKGSVCCLFSTEERCITDLWVSKADPNFCEVLSEIGKLWVRMFVFLQLARTVHYKDTSMLYTRPFVVKYKATSTFCWNKWSPYYQPKLTKHPALTFHQRQAQKYWLFVHLQELNTGLVSESVLKNSNRLWLHKSSQTKF